MELDPWAKNKSGKKARHEDTASSSRIVGYLIAVAAIGVVAAAGFEMLVLA